MVRQRRSIPFLICAALLVSGCARNSVVFATSTTLGVEVSASAENQAQAKIGFQRIEGVTMPLVEEKRVFFYKTGKIKDPGPGESAFCRIPLVSAPLCKTIYRKRRSNVHSVLSAARLDTGSLDLSGLGTLQVDQVFATGEVAATDGAMRVAKKVLRNDAGPRNIDTTAMSKLTNELGKTTLPANLNAEALKSLQGCFIAAADGPQNPSAAGVLQFAKAAFADPDGRKRVRAAAKLLEDNILKATSPPTQVEKCG